MFRRKKMENWSVQMLAKHVRVAYSDSGKSGDWEWVNAVIVLHQNPDRLPRRDVREGIEEGTFFPYVVLEFTADDHNIVAWKMGTVEEMLSDVQGFETLAEAKADAAERMPGATEMDFEELPDIMNAAFISSSTGWQPKRDI